MDESRFDVSSLGEALLRLDVPHGQRLEFAHSLEVHVGGAELNVCAALASLGRRCAYFSKLPEGSLGDLILNRLRAAGVDTSCVRRVPGARLGLYFTEPSGRPRGTAVSYDRTSSAATTLSTADIDWNVLLDTRVLHLTGITPALSPTCAALVTEAIRRAKAEEIFVSFDVNYRAKLWSASEAAVTLLPLIREVDLLLCAKRDAEGLFRLAGDDQAILGGLQELTAARCVVLTLGDAGLVAREGTQTLRQEALQADIVDRVGAGDALAAGIIDGILDNSLEDGLRRGVALAALALSHSGDILPARRQELEQVLTSSSMQIRR